MIGGTVVATLDCETRVWINVRDDAYPKSHCAIYVERNQQSLAVASGDCVWWQGGYAYWTPKQRSQDEKKGHCGIRCDIQIRKLGCSGDHHPGRALIENAYSEEPQ